MYGLSYMVKVGFTHRSIHDFITERLGLMAVKRSQSIVDFLLRPYVVLLPASVVAGNVVVRLVLCGRARDRVTSSYGCGMHPTIPVLQTYP